MAVPKRKTSKARKRKRRSHQALKLTNLTTCPRCNTPIIPHRVCPTCGFYKNVKRIEMESD